MDRYRTGVVRKGVTVLGIAVVATVLSQTAVSAAQNISRSLTYTCVFPVIGKQSAVFSLASDVPNSIAVGQPTAHYEVDASATAPLPLSAGLYLDGVRTITGTAVGQTSVEGPQGDFTEAVPFDIPAIIVPPLASFTARATGSTPAVTFSTPGKVRIVVGNLTLHLVPTDSKGNLTNLGRIDVPCTLNAGQNDVVAALTITGTAASTPANSRTTPATLGTASSGPGTTPDARPDSQNTNSSLAQASSRTSARLPAASPTESIHPASSRLSNGGHSAWVIWLGGLVAVGGIGSAALRYGPRLRNR